MVINKKITLSILMLCMVLLAGCSSATNNNNNSGAQVSAEQVINVGESFFPDNLDPAQAWNGWYVVKYGLGETLVRLNKKMELEPWLAKSWERIDNLTWKIELNEGIKFHNGREVTGEAVKASLLRALEVNPRAPQLLDIRSIKADDNSLIIKTHNPNPALIANLVDPFSVIVDASAAESAGDGFAANPVLTGPFKIAKFVKDNKVVVTKNEQYWGAKPHLDKVIFKYIPDANTLAMALQSGEIDVARGIYPESLDIFDKSDYKILSESTARSHILIFNLNKPLFQDIAVRKAINMAIDRETLANELMNGMAVPAVGPYPLVLPFYGNELNGYGLDTKQADKILTAAGWLPGNDNTRQKGHDKLKFTITTYSSRPELPLIAETIQSQLGELGIKAGIRVVENITDVLKSGDFDAAIYSMNTAVTGDPHYFLEIFFKSNADSNFGGYSNPELDKLISRLQTEFVMQERYKIAKEAQQIILDNAAYAFLVYPKINAVVHRNVKGLFLHPAEFYFLTPEVRLE